MTATTTPAAAAAAPPVDRVSTLELFFDLVFVFTVTQLSARLAGALTVAGVLQVTVILLIILWMYGGYAWLTNAIGTGRPRHRVLLLAGMCGYLVVALAIPEAYEGSGLTFGLGYLAIVTVHAALFVTGTSATVAQAILRLVPFNLVSAGLVVLGGALGATWQDVLWTAALLVWAVPLFQGLGGFEIVPTHFVERHGLVVIIAIGESIIAIGIGAAGLPVDAELVAVAVLGLLLAAALWWTYFGGDDERALEALEAAPPAARPWMVLNAFGYAHAPLLLGIICVAVGLKKATGHAFDQLKDAEALVFAGGVSIFLLGDVWFRRALRIGGLARRAGAAALALATIPLGVGVAAVAQLAALVVVAGGAATARTR